MSDDEANAKPQWDDDEAAALIGKLVLVGLTKVDHNENVLEQSQVYGRIVEARKGEGIILELEGTRAGETYRLPPTTSHFVVAGPGTYRLRSSGEEVVDPDLLSEWTIHKAPPKH